MHSCMQKKYIIENLFIVVIPLEHSYRPFGLLEIAR